MKKVFLILLIFWALPSILFAADPYWVDDNGAETTWANCQSASSMSGSSACTLATANSNIAAGDTVYLRVGTYNISGSGIDPTATGTSGNVITYSAYNDEAVEFVGAANTCRAIDLDSDSGTIRSYIKVHGITSTNFYRHLWIRKGDYNEISHCTFIGMYNPNDIEWRGSTMYRNATYNHIHDCTFGNYGCYDPNDVGVVFELGNETASNDDTSYNLIENCTFYHGGHHVLGMGGHHNVIRNNYIYNDAWSDYSGTDYSNRVSMSTGYLNDDGRNLIEGNRFGYGQECADGEIGGSGFNLCTSYNIVRKNMFYQNYIYGTMLKNYPTGPSNYNAIYNNAYWHNGHSPTAGPPPTKGLWNNIYSQGLLVDHDVTNTTGNMFKNNIFYDNANLYDEDCPLIGWGPCPPPYQVIANNWIGFVDGDPEFVNISGTPDPTQEEQFDFTLQSGSGCINNGGFLTTVTSANSSGTSFEVDNAGYFMDGWGIVDGDIIQLAGQSQEATVTNVNYTTNTITVDTSLTWTQGQGISLAYNGSAPDQGAYEYEAGAATSPSLEGITPEGCTF